MDPFCYGTDPFCYLLDLRVLTPFVLLLLMSGCLVWVSLMSGCLVCVLFATATRGGLAYEWVSCLWFVSSLRTAAHDSGSRRLATPFRAEDFHLQSLADFARRTGCLVCSYSSDLRIS